MKGSLIFEDVKGKKTFTTLNGVDSTDLTALTKLQALALSVESYINPAVREYRINRPEVQRFPTTTQGDTDTYSSSVHKAIMSFDYLDGNETRYSQLWIPAPNVAHFEHMEEVGYRMNEMSANFVRDALIAASLVASFASRGGLIEYRSGRSGRPSEGAYVKWEDFHARQQYMTVPQVDDLGRLATFAEALRTGFGGVKFTNCALREVGIIRPEIGRRDAAADVQAGHDSVDLRAILNFSWVVGDKRRSMQLMLPGFKDEYLSKPVRRGKRRNVRKVQGDAIALALTAFYGAGNRNLFFESGYCDYVNLNGE